MSRRDVRDTLRSWTTVGKAHLYVPRKHQDLTHRGMIFLPSEFPRPPGLRNVQVGTLSISSLVAAALGSSASGAVQPWRAPTILVFLRCDIFRLGPAACAHALSSSKPKGKPSAGQQSPRPPMSLAGPAVRRGWTSSTSRSHALVPAGCVCVALKILAEWDGIRSAPPLDHGPSPPKVKESVALGGLVALDFPCSSSLSLLCPASTSPRGSPPQSDSTRRSLGAWQHSMADDSYSGTPTESSGSVWSSARPPASRCQAQAAGPSYAQVPRARQSTGRSDDGLVFQREGPLRALRMARRHEALKAADGGSGDATGVRSSAGLTSNALSISPRQSRFARDTMRVWTSASGKGMRFRSGLVGKPNRLNTHSDHPWGRASGIWALGLRGADPPGQASLCQVTRQQRLMYLRAGDVEGIPDA
ncbi:unnamed protein product [Diplocarpon coronariae]